MKKIISAFLACAVMALSLAGCGGSASSSAPAAGSASSAGGSTAGTATTVSWWMDPQNMASNQVKSFSEHKGWQLYEKNVGVDIDWQEPASGQSAEQFNLIVATSDLPDIMYYSWATSYPGGPDAAIADGKIVALNDYIEEYAPNFSAYLDAHPDVRQEITTDSGNIYCFPGVYTYTSQDSDVWQDTIDREPYEESFIGLVVRKDLLDKAGLDIPVTLDDWYEALVAFKDMGIKYPLSCQAMMLTMAQCFSSAYDITVPVVGYDIGNTAFALKDDGSIFYGPAQDSYKEYLAFMNKLYSEGLLDPDFMVQDRTNVQSKVINGEVGAWVEMMPTGLGNLRRQVLADDPNSEFYPVGVLNPVLEEGQQLVYKQGNAAYIGSGAAITTSCEDIATACRVLDYGWSEEGNRILNWGIEGESYEFVDGWPKLTDSIVNNDQGIAPSEAFGVYRNLNGPYPMDHSQRLESKRDYTLQEGEVDENLKSLDLWSSSANGTVRAGLPSTTMLTEESAEYANAYNELSTYAAEMLLYSLQRPLELRCPRYCVRSAALCRTSSYKRRSFTRTQLSSGTGKSTAKSQRTSRVRPTVQPSRQLHTRENSGVSPTLLGLNSSRMAFQSGAPAVFSPTPSQNVPPPVQLMLNWSRNVPRRRLSQRENSGANGPPSQSSRCCALRPSALKPRTSLSHEYIAPRRPAACSKYFMVQGLSGCTNVHHFSPIRY